MMCGIGKTDIGVGGFGVGLVMASTVGFIEVGAAYTILRIVFYPLYDINRSLGSI